MDSSLNQSIRDFLDELLDEKSKLEEYIVNPKDLIINDLGHTQRHWPRTANHHRVFNVELSPLNTELKVERNMQTGELCDFYEVECTHTNMTAKTSTSLKRAPGLPTESVRGSSTNFPFWPGGMDEPTLDELNSLLTDDVINFETDFETVPPGFECGMDFTTVKSIDEAIQEPKTTPDTSKNKALNQVNIAQLLMDMDEDNEQLYSALDNMKLDSAKKATEETKVVGDDDVKEDSLKDIIINEGWPVTSSSKDVLNISAEFDPSKVVGQKTEWAEIVNVNIKIENFDQLVPNMAHKWDFKLDTFQQQAILHLEKQESVFVAAHTSAGKTVIAEYAIALSLKHMTRTIYTSPIKALSNQKFRDFRDTFKDVGLLTGDIQLFPNSSCLVMTTEILRLMLYNGSDVIRDLEWVIFDEVHYINDAERGVVWEEVLIMLPKHVNIVLLSATVPNTLEFADWIGRTKRKKIYVLSTPKRPVPLEHFLYVGNTPKVQNELFNIVTSDSKFNIAGYNAAKDAPKEKKEKRTNLQRNSYVSQQQEKNILICLVRLLEKKSQLPVILFTFSRKRCDLNASMLTTINLTTAAEKDKTREFVNKCILRLKGSDRRLQQVVWLTELLQQGIGVHHSGILPILREVVELLFQQGLVKLLFATETFAMGVNMPAKTVIFDTTRKHDGTENRDLNTAEYIQMAGRAGRRGLDSTGTVIILCKSDIPERYILENMILGKAVLLQSRFRLTYTMILNLLRVEQLRVQDMMRRSFSEVVKQKCSSQLEGRLKVLSNQIAGVTDLECRTCFPEIEDYYRVCVEFDKLRQEIMYLAANHHQSSKIICPGRVMIIMDKNQGQTWAVVTKVTKSTKELIIYALIAEQHGNQDQAIAELQPKTRGPAVDDSKQADNFFRRLLYVNRAVLDPPEGKCRFNVVKCALEDVVMLTKQVLKIDGDRVYSDWDKRQLPRFREDPPSQLFVMATQELLMLQNSGKNLDELDLAQDFGLKELEAMEKRLRLSALKQKINGFNCPSCTSFEDHFREVFSNTKLKDEYKEIQHQLSEESLQLIPDYNARIQVLQRLGYIDSTNTVQLKGRVSCEISNHELIITELVFDNILKDLEPPEIAAILSCMVFQFKNCAEANLTKELKKGKEAIQQTAKKIAQVQKDCGLSEAGKDYVDQFNFELAEVVYEWARGMPFVKIKELTDVQEGIIVRCIQRLDEILKDVKDAARIVGDPVLYKKMEEASHAIKRDIVFAASLYTQ